jgi:CBS domain-containing protein
MNCSELMRTDVESCPADESVEAVAERMRRLNVGFLPVCGDDGALIGTITGRDLAIGVLAGHRVPRSTTVAEVMSTDRVVCSPGDGLAQAESLMVSNKKSNIVCVDERGRPVGVIGLREVARVEGHTHEGHRKVFEILDAIGDVTELGISLLG